MKEVQTLKRNKDALGEISSAATDVMAAALREYGLNLQERMESVQECHSQALKTNCAWTSEDPDRSQASYKPYLW